MIRRHLLAALAALATVGGAAAMEVETAIGAVDAPASPAPIAVFDIAAIDTLAALGVPVAGAPERLYVDYLDDAVAQAKPVGSLHEPDLEALAALAPELIIVGGRSAARKAQTERVAPTLDMSISPDVLTDARARLAAYGALFDRAAQAAALTEKLDAGIADLRAVAKDAGTGLIVMVNGPKLSAYGEGSRFGWIHAATGLAEAHPGLAAATHGQPVSFEFVAETNPDWLFVVDRSAAIGADAAGARAVLDNPLVAATKAWRNGHVVYLDSAAIYVASGGAQATLRIVEQLTEAMADR